MVHSVWLSGTDMSVTDYKIGVDDLREINQEQNFLPDCANTY